MSQISADLCKQGVNTLWGSFEIMNPKLIKTMMIQISPIAINRANFDQIGIGFSKLKMYFMDYFASSRVEDVISTMEESFLAYNIEHVLIDNLQFMIGSIHGKFDRFEHQDYVYSAFRNFASKKQVHITLAVHPRKESDKKLISLNSIYGSAKVTQEADIVMTVQTLDESRKKRVLEVLKNRHDGCLGYLPYRFHRRKLRFKEIKRKHMPKFRKRRERKAMKSKSKRMK